MKKRSVCITIAILLSGCATTHHDGGKLTNKTKTNPVSDTYPIESVIQRMSTEQNYVMSTQQDDTSMQIHMVGKESGKTEFENQQVMYRVIESTIGFDDVPMLSMPATIYYDVEPYRYLGLKSPDGTVSIAVNNNKLPKYATVGSKGVYVTEVVYKDETKQDQVSQNTISWELVEGNTNTAMLCEVIESDAISFDYDNSSKGCYEINKEGEILGGFIEMPDPMQDSVSPDNPQNIATFDLKIY